jgi:hypothetical protein
MYCRWLSDLSSVDFSGADVEYRSRSARCNARKKRETPPHGASSDSASYASSSVVHSSSESDRSDSGQKWAA